MTVENCNPLTASIGWCEGTTVLPGIRRRLYYVSKAVVVSCPRPDFTNGTNVITDNITLAADCYWRYIDVLVNKSGITSEAQGEYPSQTQLNKLVAVHPGVDPKSAMAAAYINNNDCLFLVQDMEGRFRLIGNTLYPSKATVAEDGGQGATGTPGTTINVEATDTMPAPYYNGLIQTADDEIVQNAPSTQATESLLG